MANFCGQYERERKEKMTPARIVEVARAKGEFSVTLRWRDDWLNDRCIKLKRAGYLVGGRRQGRAVVFYPAKDAPSEDPS